jgi:hypothetical protein
VIVSDDSRKIGAATPDWDETVAIHPSSTEE